MKKIFLSICFFTCMMSANQLSAQVHEKGNVIIDAFYGGPNLFSSILRSAISSGGYQGGKVSSVGPLGGTAEYMFSSRIGLGLEVTFANTKASYSNYSYNSNTGTNEYYNYEFTSSRLRVLPRFNYHLGSSEKVDMYLTGGIGYANFKYDYTSNDPNEANNRLSYASPAGFATRVGFGTRFFFTKNFGVMAEAGIGGPLVRFGLSGKF